MAERLLIRALGHEGDGVAETPSGKVFVPFTLPGETVEADVDGERGRLVAVETPSADRVTPACRHFGVCGGCSVQHLAPEPYRAWKRDLMTTALAQRGIEAEVDPLVPIGPGTRRRAVFGVAMDGGKPTLGYYRRESHDLLAIEECPLLVPAIESKRRPLAALAAPLVDRKKRGRLTVVVTDTGLDVALDGARKLSRNDLERLAVEADSSVARLTVDGTEIFVRRLPELRQGSRILYPVAGGFLQATAESEAALAALVEAGVGDKGPFADLFSGVGTFALRLAARGPVLAVEGETALLAGLDRAARFSTGIRAVTQRKRDLFQNPMAPVELKPFRAVVIDPPRAGAKTQSEALSKSTVPRIVAVSCNPATFARDARILIDGGYRLTRVTPVDQFLWSGHVEVVAAFER